MLIVLKRYILYIKKEIETSFSFWNLKFKFDDSLILL